jgi:hypothetical protein
MILERKVKQAVKEMLEELGCISAGQAVLATANNTGWFFMPVSNGMGVHGIPDFLGEYKGRFFAIETKTPGNNPTPLQQHQIHAIHISGGLAVVVRDRCDIEVLNITLRKGL